jgi:hypothetical protein
MTPDSPEARMPDTPGLLAQGSGFVTSGSGLASSEEGVIMVMLSAVIGGFCGLMGGFIVAQISRYIGYMTGRRLWGARWVLIGAVTGALLFGIKAWVGGEDN